MDWSFFSSQRADLLPLLVTMTSEIFIIQLHQLYLCELHFVNSYKVAIFHNLNSCIHVNTICLELSKQLILCNRIKNTIRLFQIHILYITVWPIPI